MSPRISRRGFLGLAGGTLAIAGLAACGFDPSGGQTAALLTSELPLPAQFRLPLRIPPVKEPARSDPTGDMYEITQRRSDVEIVPGTRTSIFGYDGIFPGPTLETRRGRPVVVTHRNELPVPTTVHLHGGHTAAQYDGWPLDLLFPAGDPESAFHHGAVGDLAFGSREYRYATDQPAAMLWYHDHRMDFTAPQIYRGLSGMHIVRDDVEDALPLPRGERELALLICDRSFAADGSLMYPSLDRTLRSVPGVEPDWIQGVLGDVILVNGVPWPEHEVDAVRYRLRVLNGSNARRYRLALDPAGPLVQIGSDGGLLAAPVEHTSVDVAPGERFDLVVDFSGYPVGSEVTLLNQLGDGATGSIMRFRIARRATETSSVPSTLAEIETYDPAKAIVQREFRLLRGDDDTAGWVINGARFDPDSPMTTSRLGELELWRFATDLYHPVHVHLDQFQVISRNGDSPGPSDTGWKDTVDLRPAEDVLVAVRFSDHAGRFLLHCHNLEHEDMAMMARVDTV